ncbi:Predicted DNA-binding protein, contains Ribbon-helix-helix (RHH) domain [Loktanella atrilutea]|uniref:Predicted DNA-binding protein, contains Ribbon-helix-helix (RHH) domain n=1 Tax=Loktanella atrilutea TaxID=366533 RepID=A0A1M4UH79_LOKAT|nr:Predicted DNA-binding protein, contains Ribbon-helix-helix (RHH) domain [Loktanella atrilutea]
MKPPVSARPVKHSLTLRGHRTSVSLEDAFWQAFRDLAARQDMTINALATRIDAERGDVGLASAIRVHVLRDLQAMRQT